MLGVTETLGEDVGLTELVWDLELVLVGEGDGRATKL